MLCLAEFAETPTVLLIGTVFFFPARHQSDLGYQDLP